MTNTLSDGSTQRFGDPAGSRIEWTLTYEDLTDAEMAAITTLFQACEGRLLTFTFPDPTANLLGWSENLAADAWRKDPLLQLTSGAADPLGTNRATRITNTGQAAQRLDQSLAAPENLQYCFSLYARSDYTGEIITYRMSGGTGDRRTFTIGPSWKRLIISSKLDSSTETATFGLELPNGRTADVFGLQVEAQPGASQYKITAGQGGVYKRARFMDDSLTVTSQGVNRHSCRVRVTARQGN
ncbi:MAG: hypothetical protein LLG20_01055 [Acidobacteriales bacterium]|nr:hypothetical protein [Terriglobales bacterium]